MTDVVSFRPTRRELEIIERTRRAMGFRTRADAVRFLLDKGGERLGPLSRDPVFTFRVGKGTRRGRPASSREIDEELYGASP